MKSEHNHHYGITTKIMPLKNEKEFIESYKKQNPSPKKDDGCDISAVISKDVTKGHHLMKQEHNRSRKDNYHIVKDFSPDNDLKKEIKPKK